ncbi:TonB-dependent receptor [Sphingomonadaceae bacterium OTU29MARTA1]|nr:TonB-dependent receptor [Sphingomonadaceae bacterium OTU29MARTA1]
MINTLNSARKSLRASTALQALALVGAGMGAFAAAPATAQDYSQVNATGRVLSVDGAPIAGATVTVTSNEQGFTRTATTSNDGAFRVSSLPQGNYTFTIEAQGFNTFVDNAVGLSQSGAANQFTLAPADGEQSGEIVVTGRRTQVVDFDRNTTGAVINLGELATRVPVARDITSVVLLAPGTAQGDSTFGNLPAISGASVSENAYFINGLNITQFRNGLGAVTVPFDFYQTVEVKTGAVSAEFGRFTGGFINATTKSGSNDFHGGVTFNWEPDDLQSDAPNTFGSDNDADFSERKDFIAQLSGPIIKDHLFFYGIYNSRDVQSKFGSTALVSTLAPAATATATTRAYSCAVNPSFCLAFPDVSLAANLALAGSSYAVSRNTSPFFGGKVDAVIVDGQRLEATYFNTKSTTFTQYSGTSAFSLAGGRYNPITNDPGLPVPANVGGSLIERSGGENYVFRYTGTFTDWFTLSGAYGKNKNRSTTESSAPNFSSITDQRSGTSVALGNTVANTSTAFDNRTFYRADADIYVNLLGSHHFRGGYDREELVAQTATLANGNYQITYGLSSATGTVRTTAAQAGIVTGGTYAVPFVQRRYFQNGGAFETLGEAYYIQDSWTLFSNRLNINLGIRNDHFVNQNAEGSKFFDSKNNWGPRLNASFDPIGDGRTKIYGSFNRYFLPVATNTNVRLAGSELDYTQYYVLNGVNPDQTPIYGRPIVGSGAVAGTSVAGLNLGRACPPLTVAPSGVANCRTNSDGTTPPFQSLVAQNLQAQSEDEYTLGFEQRLGSRWRVGAYYTQRNLRQSLEDAYIDAGVQAYCRRTLSGASLASCLDVFTGAHQYALLNPGQDVTVVLDGAGSTVDGQTATLTAADLGLPQAKRTYKSMTFTVDREFDGKWSLSANYTLSALVGNIEGGVRSDNGQADSGLTTNFDFPALVNGAYGFLPGHRRHNLKIYGSYQLVDAVNIGLNFQLTSPRKFGCIGTVPDAVDGGNSASYGAAGFYCNVDSSGNVVTLGSTDTRALTPRGSVFQSDWSALLNLDVGIKVPTDAFDGTLRLSVFNILNSQAALDFNEVGTTGTGLPLATYGLTSSYQAPRSARIQFGVNF